MTPAQPALLRPADVPAMAALHAAAFPPADAWGADALELMLGLEGGFGFLLPGRGFVLARAVGGEAEILTLAVAPEARRQGAGAALLHAAMTEAWARQAEQLFLEVSARNEAAQALYAAAGFEAVGRRRHYYTDGADALVLSRRPGGA